MDDRGTSPDKKAPIRREDIGTASMLELLALEEAGSPPAVDALLMQYVRPLQRWARRRLAGSTHDTIDTDDVVVETVFETLMRLRSFEPQQGGALHAYLRQAIINRLREQVRGTGQHRADEELADDVFVDEAASPFDEEIGRESADRYELALSRLRPEERQAIILRVELQLPYARVAEELKKPTADAARAVVARALVRLAEEMGTNDPSLVSQRPEPDRPGERDDAGDALQVRALADADSPAVLGALGAAVGHDLFLAGPICRATVRTPSASALLDLDTISARLPYASLTSDLDRVALVAVHASGAIRGLSGQIVRRGTHLTVELEPTGVIDPQGDEPPSLDGGLTWSFDLAVVSRASHAARRA